MFERKGDNRKEAIVLDDSDPEENNFVDFFDNQRPAQVKPEAVDLCDYSPVRASSTSVKRHISIDPPITSSNLQVPPKINVPRDEDFLIYGEEFKKSVQSLTEPVSRDDQDLEITQVLSSPKESQKQPPECKLSRKSSGNDYALQPGPAPTARMLSPSNGRTSARPAIEGDCCPKVQAQNDLKATARQPSSTITTPARKQEQDHNPSGAPQPARKSSAISSSSGKEANTMKSRSLAERWNLQKLPCITDGQDQPMGFAALPSAKDDPRYASLKIGKHGETANTEKAARKAVGNSKALGPVPLQAVLPSTAASKIRRKPRPRKESAKKPDVPQPTFDVLKPNQKRPLSEIGFNQLFKPAQVISSLAWESRKRQRLEKKQSRALEDSSSSKERRDELINDPVEVGDDMHNSHVEEPEVIDFGGDETPERMGKCPTKKWDTMNAQPSREPESKGADPERVPESNRPSPHEMPRDVDEEVAILEEDVEPKPATVNVDYELLSELVVTEREAEPWTGETKLHDPAFKQAEGKKSVHFEPGLRKPAPKEQATSDSKSQSPKATSSEDSAAEPPDPPPTTRPTTGGKGISEATLAASRATETGNITRTASSHTVDEYNDEFIVVEEPVYEYHVHRREWLTEDLEGEANARIQALGPYYTLQEANTIAAREIRHPIQHGTTHGIPTSAWDYGFRQDCNGLQTQLAEAMGVHIEAEVQRGESSSMDRSPFEAAI